MNRLAPWRNIHRFREGRDDPGPCFVPVRGLLIREELIASNVWNFMQRGLSHCNILRKGELTGSLTHQCGCLVGGECFLIHSQLHIVWFVCERMFNLPPCEEIYLPHFSLKKLKISVTASWSSSWRSRRLVLVRRLRCARHSLCCIAISAV